MARLAFFAVLCLASGPQQAINWMRLEHAKSLAERNGKLVLVYVACDPGSGMPS